MNLCQSTKDDNTTAVDWEGRYRASDKRQELLLELGDALRAENDPDALGSVAVRMIDEYLGVDRCYLVEVSVSEDRATVLVDYHAADSHTIKGDSRFSDFPVLMRRAGESVVLDDVRNNDQLSRHDKEAFASLDMGSALTRTVRKGDHDHLWALTITTRDARTWTDEEKQVVAQAAERVWAAIEQPKLMRHSKPRRIARTGQLKIDGP